MKYNLATAVFNLWCHGQGLIKFLPSQWAITFRTSGFDAESSYAVVGPWTREVHEAEHPVMDFRIINFGIGNAWTRETVTLHLLMHNADDLARLDIGYMLDAEAVELPPFL